MADYLTVQPDALQAFATQVFEALETPEDIAAEVGAHLVRANLAGHDSHGVIRIPQYALQVEQGVIKPAARPTVARERAAALLVDGARGFGQFATLFALERAIERARDTGVAAAAVRGANHIGRLGDYAERAAQHGFVAELTVGGAGPGVGASAPYGGTTRLLGTNPWSIGVPNAAGDPVLVDFATTVVAEGKVRVARAKHEALPPGCIVDKEGRPSTDPEDFYAGGTLLPFGGHKGYGLSLAAALLGGLASGEEQEPAMGATPRTGQGGRARIGGVLVLVIDPGAFGDRDGYASAVGRVTEAIRRAPPAPGGKEVLLPGDPEARTRAQRRRAGIALPVDTWAAIEQVASKAGVSMPAHT